MEDCVFCKIAADELPSIRVYEDDSYIALMDLSPLSPGHVLVIPKEHHRYVWDVTGEDFTHYMNVVHRVAKALQGTFGTDMIYSRIMGEEVHHAHVWLFPSPEKALGDKDDREGNAKKIRARLT